MPRAWLRGIAPGIRGGVVSSLFLFAAFTACAEEPQAIEAPTDFWGLAGAGGDRVFPLHATIDVLYYDSGWNVLWATWNGVGCYIPPGTKPLPIQSGQRIELEGFAIPGKQEILWDRTKIRTLEEKLPLEPVELPDPLRQPMDYNLKYVTAAGLVSTQGELDGAHTRLVIVSPDRKVTAQVLVQPDSPLPQFVGAFVRVQGVFSVKENVTGDALETEIWVSDIRHIQVASWLATDPRFDTPVVLSDALDRLPGDRLVHVEGVVHKIDPGDSITLRDAGGEVRVMTLQPDGMVEGQKLEAVGYPVVDGVETRLRRAYVRPVKSDGSATNASATSLVSKLRLSDQVRQLGPEDAEKGYPSTCAAWSPGRIQSATPSSSWIQAAASRCSFPTTVRSRCPALAWM